MKTQPTTDRREQTRAIETGNSSEFLMILNQIKTARIDVEELFNKPKAEKLAIAETLIEKLTARDPLASITTQIINGSSATTEEAIFGVLTISPPRLKDLNEKTLGTINADKFIEKASNETIKLLSDIYDVQLVTAGAHNTGKYIVCKNGIQDKTITKEDAHVIEQNGQKIYKEHLSLSKEQLQERLNTIEIDSNEAIHIKELINNIDEEIKSPTFKVAIGITNIPANLSASDPNISQIVSKAIVFSMLAKNMRRYRERTNQTINQEENKRFNPVQEFALEYLLYDLASSKRKLYESLISGELNDDELGKLATIIFELNIYDGEIKLNQNSIHKLRKKQKLIKNPHPAIQKALIAFENYIEAINQLDVILTQFNDQLPNYFQTEILPIAKYANQNLRRKSDQEIEEIIKELYDKSLESAKKSQTINALSDIGVYRKIAHEQTSTNYRIHVLIDIPEFGARNLVEFNKTLNTILYSVCHTKDNKRATRITMEEEFEMVKKTLSTRKKISKILNSLPIDRKKALENEIAENIITSVEDITLELHQTVNKIIDTLNTNTDKQISTIRLGGDEAYITVGTNEQKHTDIDLLGDTLLKLSQDLNIRIAAIIDTDDLSELQDDSDAARRVLRMKIQLDEMIIKLKSTEAQNPKMKINQTGSVIIDQSAEFLLATK